MPLKTEQRAALNQNHYLAAHGSRARLQYHDEHGLIVFASCSSRRLPVDWLELSRWCIAPPGRGSRQWSACVRWLCDRTMATTIVSYSDPSVGHTGALYRACNWIWAPTWHVLREPPTGAGIRGGKLQRAKHRWVYPLRPDDRRADLLSMKDEAIGRRFPWANYVEPKWRRGIAQTGDQGRFRRWAECHGAEPARPVIELAQAIRPQLDLFGGLPK